MLRAHGVDDLLGYAGHVLGRLPDRSVLVLTLRGSRLRAVVRVDPPPADPATWSAWAGAVAGVCRNDTDADRTVVLRIDAVDGSMRDGGGAEAWWPVLRDALGHVGLTATEGWTVAGGHARPLGAGWVGREGLAVDPVCSDVSLHLMCRGSVWGARERDLLPPARRAPCADGPAWRAGPVGDAAAWLRSWEPLLDGRAGASEACRPSRGAGLRRPAWRDLLLVSAAVGLESALEASGGPGASWQVDDRLAGVLTADTPEAPRWARLDRLWEACRALAETAPDEVAGRALALAAFVAWARGQGSAAGAHLDAAEGLAPGDGLAPLLRRVVDVGLVSGWARSPETAWRAESAGREPRP